VKARRKKPLGHTLKARSENLDIFIALALETLLRAIKNASGYTTGKRTIRPTGKRRMCKAQPLSYRALE
jgi:hypothetical protein